MVGRALSARLAGLGHDVVIGTRDPEPTLARSEPDARQTPPFAEWAKSNPTVSLLPFPEAGRHGEVILNATAGIASLAALEATGAENLAGKVLLDLSVPLDRGVESPPPLLVANTDSVGEQIQRTYPDARVVKTLNTMFVEVMIDPNRLPSQHNVFV